MSDIKLFRLTDLQAEELPFHFVPMEKNLQTLLERNMETCLGIRFIAHEYGTGRVHRGFIDSLGLDENNAPVIVEYKRRANDNVINQGLFYLDWLLDHKADFINLVQKNLGKDSVRDIDFSNTRVICIAGDFSRFDERAICQIDRNVELVRYKVFGDNLLMIEMLNTAMTPFLDSLPMGERSEEENEEVGMPPALRQRIRNMNPDTEKLYLELLSYAQTLGEDVSIRFLKHYVALTRLRNFTSIQPLKTALKLWLNLEPDEYVMEGFSRNVRNIGHHSSGNLEVDVHNEEDFEKVRPLIEIAYQKN